MDDLRSISSRIFLRTPGGRIFRLASAQVTSASCPRRMGLTTLDLDVPSVQSPAVPVSIARVLVLGLGNDILTDDAVGLRVATAVRLQVAGSPDIEAVSYTHLTLPTQRIV